MSDMKQAVDVESILAEMKRFDDVGDVALLEKYQELAHKVQTGVAVKMDRERAETEPKHLRVGVNMALCDSSAVARLLMAKGVFTPREYMQALCAVMQAEVDRYSDWVHQNIGPNVHIDKKADDQ